MTSACCCDGSQDERGRSTESGPGTQQTLTVLPPSRPPRGTQLWKGEIVARWEGLEPVLENGLDLGRQKGNKRIRTGRHLHGSRHGV